MRTDHAARWRSAPIPPTLSAMRRIALLLGFCSTLLLVGDSVASTQASTLRIVSARPLVVAGSGFKPGERVRVVVRHGDRRWTKYVRVGSARAFSLPFGTLPVSRCGLVAQAFGSLGSRAATKPAEPACAEPIVP